eukprot:TRINITY_DN5032_c0_g2_i1.p1 TRINITY_DN5032_c0_g2~~TRINITY_DN5032_c0_g2_i1.p1  ORF type:complete len:161 (+),score=7.93 TRINITY_DN5032_c0_g2_i1:42-524(+)
MPLKLRKTAEAAETAETATLISTISSTGSLEWISLHTDHEWIHCSFLPDTLCQVATPLLGYKNTLFVEGAFPVESQDGTLDDQLNECRGDCEKTSDTCNFWTFSYHQGHSDSLSRNHAGKSECGLRNYDACCVIPTNRAQWFGYYLKIFPSFFQPAPYTI